MLRYKYVYGILFEYTVSYVHVFFKTDLLLLYVLPMVYSSNSSGNFECLKKDSNCKKEKKGIFEQLGSNEY